MAHETEPPLWERWSRNENGEYLVTQIKIENQRRYTNSWLPPFLANDLPNFTDLNKKFAWGEEQENIGSEWEVKSDWQPKVNDVFTDVHGWVYGKTFNLTKHNKQKFLDFARSRFLCRQKISVFKAVDSLKWGEYVKCAGNSLEQRIQYGIKIALMKNCNGDDFLGRNYFFLSDNDNVDFQFQDYAPNTFKKIRELYGIDQTRYIREICDESLVGGKTNDAGKSGQIFWRSRNKEFVIKTVTHNETIFLQKSLKDYLYHMQNNKHTLISRFYGLHKIKIGMTRIRFIVMNNVFSTCKQTPQLIYDLKGTTEDRLVKHSANTKRQPILKDLNFNDRYILVSKNMSECLLEQIKTDVCFFLKIGIMDYSLLLGVCVNESVDKSGETSNSNDIQFSSDLVPINYPNKQFLSKASMFECGIKGSLGEIYHIGIIDILQNWNKKKKAANIIKTVAFFDYKQKKIDSVCPEQYGDRFLKYVQKKIRHVNSFGSYSMGLDKLGNRILINCNSASDLITTDLFGFSCNPYVLIQFGDKQSVTSIVKKNVHPVWGHFCSFFAERQNVPKFIKFTVLNSELGFPPSVIGTALLPTRGLFETTVSTYNLPLLSDKDASAVINPRLSTRNAHVTPKSHGVLNVSLEMIIIDGIADKKDE